MPRCVWLSPAILALAAGAWFASCSDATPTTGPELFNAWGCVQCHAESGVGVSGLGPSLLEKQKYWTRDTLLAYLRDPKGYAAKDPRLKEQGRSFMTPMPPVLAQDEVLVGLLIDHVLAMR